MRAKVHIDITMENGVTRLRRAYCTQPYKVMDVTEDRTDGILRLMLMSSSPGILDGDQNELEFELGPGCVFELQTQSYQRLFHMQQGARQNTSVMMQKGSSFIFLPHPVVPHESSDFVAVNKIYLMPGCKLVWGEVITCGRKLNGEVFRFTRYHAITEIFLCGKLVIKENLLMQPGIPGISGLGLLEGFTHQASLIFLQDNMPVKEMISITGEWLAGQPGIIYGITAAPVNGIVIRMLGNKAEQLHHYVKILADIIQSVPLKV